MKTITIGRENCDIVISDGCVSRKHATISLVNGQYVYTDTSKNGTTINGKIYQNERIVIAPGTPVYLSNKIPLPWAQILMLLPNQSVEIQAAHNGFNGGGNNPVIEDESIGIGWGVFSFLFPVVGFILYFVWKDTSYCKAKQASNIAWISIAISFAIGFIRGLSM